MGISQPVAQSLYVRGNLRLSMTPLKLLRAKWPAAGFEDTELGVNMEPEVDHGATEIYTRVQA